jgi:two-component system sensor histidine kinase KdpD
VLKAGRTTLERTLGVDAWLRVGEVSEASSGSAFEAIDQAAADWVLAHGQPAGRHTDTLAGSEWWFLPLRDGKAAIGVVGLRFGAGSRRLTAHARRLAEAMADDIAQAALRTRLVSDLEGARVANETERLRSALLSSVSHDLRSPLAAMVGSASSLANYASAMNEDDRKSLLDTILLEGDRLDRYIQNLLDMTRLGHDGLTLNRDWIGVDELVGSATGRLRRYQPDVKLQVNLAADLPTIWVHPALIEQALFNVLENAAKFSPPGEAIDISARVAEGRLQLDVRDRGPGIPEQERSRIFDMFYSVGRGDPHCRIHRRGFGKSGQALGPHVPGRGIGRLGGLCVSQRFRSGSRRHERVHARQAVHAAGCTAAGHLDQGRRCLGLFRCAGGLGVRGGSQGSSQKALIRQARRFDCADVRSSN